jgi:hypothetical protein
LADTGVVKLFPVWLTVKAFCPRGVSIVSAPSPATLNGPKMLNASCGVPALVMPEKTPLLVWMPRRNLRLGS